MEPCEGLRAGLCGARGAQLRAGRCVRGGYWRAGRGRGGGRWRHAPRGRGGVSRRPRKAGGARPISAAAAAAGGSAFLPLHRRQVTAIPGFGSPGLACMRSPVSVPSGEGEPLPPTAVGWREEYLSLPSGLRPRFPRASSGAGGRG